MLSSSNRKNFSPINQLVKNEPDLISLLKEGDLIEVKFLKKTPRAAYFDLDKFGTGIVYGAELINAKNILKDLKVGDLVSAKVLDLENEDGFIELSLVSALQQKKWQNLKELKEKGEILTVKIIGANSGGLVANINGIKAFLPISHLASNHYPQIDGLEKNKVKKNKILEELRKLVNKEIKVKIIDFNPRTGKLIISERETIEQGVKEVIGQYKIGDIINGIVSNITDFGVFVRFLDNPTVEGLIHVSELDHRVVDNPREVIDLNESVRAKIIEIKDNRLLLSLKTLKPDPWENIKEKIKEGQEVTGTVYKLSPVGAYINLEGGLQGLIHISEFGSLEEMKKKLELNKKYQFIVESIKTEEKRIILKSPGLTTDLN